MKRFAVIACITATLLLVAVVVALLVAQTVCAGQRSEDPVHYSVHGRGVSRGQALAGGGHTWIYSVQVNDCRWRIRIMPLDFVEQGLSQAPAPLTILPDYLEAAFDGENYFQVKSFQSTSVPESRHSHIALGLRATEVEPVLNTRELKALWYLYASHCLSPVLGEMNPPPLEPAPRDSYRHGSMPEPAEFRRLTAPPGLVEYVRFGRSPSEFSDKGLGAGQERVLKGEQLAVMGVTNVGSLRIPARAALHAYLSVAGTGPWLELDIHAERVLQDAPQEGFLPSLPGNTMIEDARFWRSNPPFHVAMIAARWPAPHEFDVRYREMTGRSSLGTRQDFQEHAHRRRWVLLTMALLFAAAVLVLWRSQRKHTTNERTNEHD